MAADRRLIATTPQKGLRPLAAGGLRVAASHGRIDAFLRQQLEPEHAELFAEPQPNDADGTTDWYASGEGPVRSLDELAPEERAAVEERLARLSGDIGQLADRLAASERSNLRVLSELLRRALHLPGPQAVRVVGGRPVLVDWGHERVASDAAPVDLVGFRPIDRPAPDPAPPPAPPPAAAAIPAAAGAAAVPAQAVAEEPRPAFGWLAPLLWLLFAALMAGIYYLLLQACAISAPGPGDDDNPLLAFCPGRAVAAYEPPPELAQEQARNGVLRQRLLDLERKIAGERAACSVPGGSLERPARTETPSGEVPPERSETPRDEYQERVSEAGGQEGKVQVTLLWDTRDDLDLLVRCPSGELISFQSRQGCGGGRLDVDANDMSQGSAERTTRPVENITWTEGAPAGTYAIYVTNQETVEPIDYRIRVSVNGADREYAGKVKQSDNLVRVAEFTIP